MKWKRPVPRQQLSLVPSKEPADHRTESAYFPRDAPAHKESMAVVVQAKAGRNPQRPAGRQIPGENGRKVMCSIVKAKIVPVAEPAIHFDPANEVLRTDRAALRGGLESERTAGTEGITEFPR